ncbi:MAG: phosphate ABC transporter permease PstA [Actinomycetota bacterium]|nr:phosphate ABC transporter permease PstA [Actinomycetota bacterium]
MAQLTAQRPPDSQEHVALRHARLPRWAPGLVAVIALAAAALLALAMGWGVVAVVIIAALIYVVALPGWSRVVENSRAAMDRLVTALVWGALALALVPLVSLLWKVFQIGAPQVTGHFLTWSMRNVVGTPGGVYHAIIGTLLITLTAAVISVPIGLLTAVYLVEYGRTSKLAGWIRLLVDVMTGIPSIVAGLFAYALFSLLFGPGTQIGLGGGVALSLLMIPIVVRSSEEMLKLVPTDLREASYALGVPKWKTILKVVVPTAMAGIITGVTLAIARVIGETAPLLIVCGATDSVNFNLLHGQMASLPVFIYSSYTQPGINPQILQNMAWGAAFILIVIVMVLNLFARVMGRILAPKSGH